MKLFIRIVDGKPFEHPIIESNFMQAFPDIDLENLPSDFALFERVECPIIKPYELYEGTTYERFGNVYRDVHHIRPMTEEEKALHIAYAKQEDHPEGWIFSETWCRWIHPADDISAPGKTPDVIG